jgi:tetratricopeptide (TPR) repeat protein
MNKMEKWGAALLIFGIIILWWGTFQALAFPDVKVWEEPLVIPTYLVREPDKFPLFYNGRAYQGAKGLIYPYPMLDTLTDQREDKTYKALYLENDYVKICVLPEIGGRIFTALDKTNNYDFFYHQHVIKPALIGMLGAWISGGVEWNFPHHHRATSFMPVDYTLTENPDGSKTIWVGEVEIRHRTKWIIGLTLYPGRSYLEATVKLFNRTPIAQSMLYWANVAVHANEDYQIIFPPGTEFATFHGKNQFSRWPFSGEVFNRVDYTQGVDISWYKNHPAPTSFFAWNSEQDFSAGYDHGKKAGVVHVADHHIAPGKKFWTWGTGTQGKMWEKILTDADGPYIELMVGAYSDNQPDYSWLQPYEARVVKQHWFPLREIQGVKKANLEAALYLETNPEGFVQMGLNTTTLHRGAKVVLSEGKKVVFEKTIDISPEAPYFEELKLPAGVPKEDLQLTLNSPSGERLISYAPVKLEGDPMPEPIKPPPAAEEIGTVDELYHTGLRLEQFLNPALEPYPFYEEALKRDPDNYAVNASLAILDYKRGRYAQAEEKLNRALQRATKNYTRPKDGEAFYYLGVVQRAQHRYDEACDAFYNATWSHGWGAASYYQLAELACIKIDYWTALEFIDRSLVLNSLNLRAGNLKAALLRKTGGMNEAAALVAEIVLADPLNFWALNERYLQTNKWGGLDKATERLDDLENKLRDELQNFLELAVDYGNCGLWDEAIDVLSRLEDKELGFPMVYYYLGYYLEKSGDGEKAIEYYKKASQMPSDYCFPFRWESRDVLEQALKKNPGDPKAFYYLGNLLFDHQPEEAIKRWEKSVALDSRFAPAHRNLGLAYARVYNDVARAIESMEKACAFASSEPRLYYELDLMYEAGGVSSEERLALLIENHEIVKKRDDALSREIGLLVQLEDYDRAIELLQIHHFHVWEGGGRIHSVYVDAHLLRGLQSFSSGDNESALKSFLAALEYPENLEVGRPVRGGGEPKVQYFVGTAYEDLGENDKAKEYYEKAVEQEISWSELSYYQGMSYQRMGRKEDAARIFSGLMEFAQERLKATADTDFFAKFGERQSAVNRKAQAHYILGLSYLGNGDKTKAKAEFAKALELQIDHLWAKHYLASLAKNL